MGSQQPRRSGGLPPRPSWPLPIVYPDQNGAAPAYGTAPQMPAQFPQPVRSGYIPSGPISYPLGHYEPSPNDLAAAMLAQNMQQMQQLWEMVTANKDKSSHGRGRAAKRGGGRKASDRAPFSVGGNVTDRTKSTIVVESIPDQHLKEDAVRDAFSEFGTIVDVTIQLYHRLAIVKYDAWHAANAAYRSTKAFFDNRFVKASGIDNTPEEPEFDLDAFIKKQDEAQKAYEEKRQRQQELEKQRQDLTERQRDLFERQREIRLKLLEKLGQASGGEDGTDGSSNNEVLRAQLAALEEEAKYLGLDPNADDVSTYGGFRGGYRGRGRGRGAHRGRGGHVVDRAAVYAAFEQYTLDNRTRVVEVSGVDFSDSEKDEALRQHLFGIGEFNDIQITPMTAQITFKSRKTAERFLHAAKLAPIPNVGSVEVAWVENGPAAVGPAAAVVSTAPLAPARDPVGKNEPDVAVERRASAEPQPDVKREPKTEVDMDYELYEDGEWVD
ncbi:30S ribosomal protein S10 [Verticillium dahliae VDG1]|nr:30S ribosomal protein S10 [Verticillium dahliae VDG1]